MANGCQTACPFRWIAGRKVCTRPPVWYLLVFVTPFSVLEVSILAFVRSDVRRCFMESWRIFPFLECQSSSNAFQNASEFLSAARIALTCCWVRRLSEDRRISRLKEIQSQVLSSKGQYPQWFPRAQLPWQAVLVYLIDLLAHRLFLHLHSNSPRLVDFDLVHRRRDYTQLRVKVSQPSGDPLFRLGVSLNCSI